MYTLAIIDDDQYFLEFLEERIIHRFSQYVTIHTYPSITSFLKDNSTFDLLILDIDLPEIDGIQFAKHYALNTPILFVTSQENRVYEAFGEHIVGFIKKDEIDSKLNPALISFIQKHSSPSCEFQTTLGTLHIIQNDMLFFCRENRKIYLYTKQNEYRLTGHTLSSLKTMLPDYFVFIDKSTLVNIHSIIKIQHNDIILSNGSKLSISRNRVKEVKQQILAEEMKNDRIY